MVLLHAALLGAVQGLTEFLPVSSSAHLILARAFFGWDTEQFGVPFDVACHLGTLVAVIIYFREDLRAMLRALPGAFSIRLKPDATSVYARLIRLIAIGTTPVAVVGAVWGRALEEGMRTLPVIVITLSGVAVLFLIAEAVGTQRRDAQALTVTDALLMGVAQAAALIPGISRSGATISTGLLAGIARPDAARFSFLLGIPAILAAAAHEGLTLRHEPLAPGTGSVFVVGVAASAIVGYAAVAFFLRFVARHSLRPFAVYRLALAAIALVWLLR